MWNPNSRVQVLRDLQFALEVMEERSHLGLTDEAASSMKKAILNRIAHTEKNLQYRPAATSPELAEEEVLTA